MSASAALKQSASPEVIESSVPGMGRPLPIKLSRIKRYEGQPRKEFPPESIEELADHIQANGQQTPVRVCTDPASKGSFILIGGERRWRAFQKIQDRTGKEPMVNAFIEVIDPKEHFKKAFIDNVLREDLLPLEMAESLHRLHYNDGESLSALAKLVGKSTTYVENYIKVHTLPDEVKHLMHLSRPVDIQLNITSAIDIARSTPDQELRIVIAREVIERRLGVNDTRTLIEMRTGEAGWRVGGFQRKSSDDYKEYTSFLGRTRQGLEKYLKLDYESMYFDRDDEAGDRETDAESIRSLIGGLQQLLKRVEEKHTLR